VGIQVDCVDTSRDRLDDAQIAAAAVIAFYLPMHTATKLAGSLIDRVRRVNPAARLCAYGLYAPLNAQWLLDRGIHHVLGPEAESDLVELVVQSPKPKVQGHRRLHFIQPDRSSLPPIARYASVRMPDGSHRAMGSTDATRGCKHSCRHCPIVPVYRGRFHAVPVDVVLEDIRAQVAAGAEHISFGDPDFLNGPAHARRIVERMHREFPLVSYDVTIKIEHLLRRADMLPMLRDTGCLFITSAVEAIDDRILANLRKGHTRRDFVDVVALCKKAGVVLAPTFIPFTPWTTLDGYVEMLDLLEDLELVEEVAPVQLAIRLLITAESPLLELPEVRDRVSAFDPASLTWPWRHLDPNVDALQAAVMQKVSGAVGCPRSDVFEALSALARGRAGRAAKAGGMSSRAAVPYVTEPWYCCAEPLENV
jgi:radical SAM superfamily enzyme YgiQ (UPF0313 family)